MIAPDPQGPPSLQDLDPQTEIVRGCFAVRLPVISDVRGDLTFVEPDRQVPFEIRRVYYLYSVPEGEMRAGHAHYALHQLVIPVAGSFDVMLDDGAQRRTVRLDREDSGLLISHAVWREISGFSTGAVCLVLASLEYDEADYMRDYDDFLAYVGAGDRDEVRRITTEGLGQHTVGPHAVQ